MVVVVAVAREGRRDGEGGVCVSGKGGGKSGGEGGDNGGGSCIGGGSVGGKRKDSGVGSGGALYIIVPVKIVLIYRNFSYMKLT